MEIIDYNETKSSLVKSECRNITMYAATTSLKYIVNVFEETYGDNDRSCIIKVSIYDHGSRIFYGEENRSYFTVNKTSILSYLEDRLEDLVAAGATRS